MSLFNISNDLLLETKNEKTIEYDSRLFSLISSKFNLLFIFKINNHIESDLIINSNKKIVYKIDIEYEILKIMLSYYETKEKQSFDDNDILTCIKIYFYSKKYGMNHLHNTIKTYIFNNINKFVSLFMPDLNINDYCNETNIIDYEFVYGNYNDYLLNTNIDVDILRKTCKNIAKKYIDIKMEINLLSDENIKNIILKNYKNHMIQLIRLMYEYFMDNHLEDFIEDIYEILL